MLYKHRNNTGVAIEVRKRFFVAETQQVKMKVRWWNIGLRDWQVLPAEFCSTK
jgi:hypothetical protein